MSFLAVRELEIETRHDIPPGGLSTEPSFVIIKEVRVAPRGSGQEGTQEPVVAEKTDIIPLIVIVGVVGLGLGLASKLRQRNVRRSS